MSFSLWPFLMLFALCPKLTKMDIVIIFGSIVSVLQRSLVISKIPVNRLITIIFATLFSVVSITLCGQSCDEFELATTYIESVLVADLFYTGEFTKEEIKEPEMWYMHEKLSMNSGIKEQDSKWVENHKVIELPDQITTRQKANYLLFTSDIYNGQLLVKLLHNRDPSFNLTEGKTEFEKCSRMNGGMVYLFQFDESGCLVGVS